MCIWYGDCPFNTFDCEVDNPHYKCKHRMHEDTKSEILSTCTSIGEAINKAAKHLPPGWIISIEIEKDGYGVVLRDQEGILKSIKNILKKR